MIAFLPQAQTSGDVPANDSRFGEPVMSSREIAGLLGKQHSNIKISAERLAAAKVIGTLAAQEFTHNGNAYTEYMLNKRDSLVLVAQNCPEFTARIIDRWQELEAAAKRPALPDFSDPVAAARAWADAKEAERNAALALKAAAPAIAHHAAVSRSENDFTFQEMARILAQHGNDIGRNRMMSILRDAGVLGVAKNSHNIPMQQYVERGYFKVVESTRENEKDGVVSTYTDITTYVTGTGHNWLIKRWPDIVSAAKKRSEDKAKKLALVN